VQHKNLKTFAGYLEVSHSRISLTRLAGVSATTKIYPNISHRYKREVCDKEKERLERRLSIERKHDGNAHAMP
jgi:hypothetical protein